MEAKDTVMSPELQKVYEGNQLAGLEWQAEITWQAAIKEVVEDFEKAHSMDIKSPNTTHIRVSKLWWQLQKKAWGIED